MTEPQASELDNFDPEKPSFTTLWWKVKGMEKDLADIKKLIAAVVISILGGFVGALWLIIQKGI